MEYGQVLAYYLDKQGMTKAQLAYAIGSPRSTIGALVSGRAKEPTLGKAKAIADALGVPLQDMVSMMFDEETEV